MFYFVIHFLLIQECLCALAVDESGDVSSTAQDFLECLFSQSWKPRIELDAAEIFIRFIFLFRHITHCGWFFLDLFP